MRKIVFTLLFLLLAAHGQGAEKLRIVSLAPSITELLFAIGAGGQVVGVTEHCIYPPEALALPKIGGFISPNYERILSLAPDLVVMTGDHQVFRPMLDDLGIASLEVDHRGLDGLLDSYRALGRICGVEERGIAESEKLRKALLPSAPIPPNAPRALLVIGRDYGGGAVGNAYAVGADGMYEKVMAASGLRNAYVGGLAYPMLSGEGIAVMNPDLVVEIISSSMANGAGDGSFMDDWRTLPEIDAVRRGNVHFIVSDRLLVPGPQLLRLKRDLEEIGSGGGPAGGGAEP
jgi:iron complex transport system substrate-binding protein